MGDREWRRGVSAGTVLALALTAAVLLACAVVLPRLSDSARIRMADQTENISMSLNGLPELTVDADIPIQGSSGAGAWHRSVIF